MEAYVFWFTLAVIFLGVEVGTGTFYFLVLSAASVVGGILAMTGLGMTLQYAVPAVLAVAGTMALRQMKKSRRAAPGMSLDIGQPVKVVSWSADGTARVFYRGAEWDAEPESPAMPREGAHYIKSMQANKLIITQHRPE